jgi:hypothetical protein
MGWAGCALGWLLGRGFVVRELGLDVDYDTARYMARLFSL